MALIEDVVKTITEVCPPTADEDVSGWAKRFTAKNITKEFVTEFAKTDDYNTTLRPFVDQKVSQGVDTFEKGAFEDKLKIRLETKLRELNPNETEDQKRARIEKERADGLAHDKLKGELLNDAIMYCMKKKHMLGEDLLKAVVKAADSSDDVHKLIDQDYDRFVLERENITNSVMKDHNIIPKSGDGNHKFSTIADIERYLKAGNPYTKEIDAEYNRLGAHK
jgi:hypothetical protein